ncbi:MAG: MBL fold metallo-hydrolase [Rhodospirillaceae bacterium]|jgi:UDP-MurNAc hydroxylase
MQFRILSHACLEVSTPDTTLLTDPWVVGSAYWRSWWNYPPIPDGLVDTLKPDFIYLTHLHWDHFHGVSLKKLGLDRHILVPRLPDRRLIGDLEKLGANNITELAHGEPFQLGEDLTVTIYQFGVFPDSVLVIQSGGVTILNANDAKIMGGPLKQVLRDHPNIDFVLRSHSSANSRLCYEITDREFGHIDDLEKYNREFAAFAKASGARYAIPFASNHCYLHEETFRFNDAINFAPDVKRFFEDNGINTPECMIMAPGDSWDSEKGFNIHDADWYSNFKQRLADYRDAKEPTLARNREAEAKNEFKDRLLQRYVEGLHRGSPWLLRRIFKNHPVTFIVHAGGNARAFEIDVYRGTFRYVDSVTDEANPIQFNTASRIFQECIAMRNWNSLGISKRVRFRVRDADKRYVFLFLALNNLFDYDILPLGKSMNRRFIGVWLKRWREVLLYFRIVFDLLVCRKSLDYERYLPKA